MSHNFTDDESQVPAVAELELAEVRLALGRRGLLLGPDAALTPVMVDRLLGRVEMLAKAVIYAHLALDLDMGDDEPTFQCCRAVCGHGPVCPVGDMLDFAMRITELTEADIEPLNSARLLAKQEPVTSKRITGAPGAWRRYLEAERLLERDVIETWREALLRFAKSRGCEVACLASYDVFVERGDDELRAAWCALYDNRLLPGLPSGDEGSLSTGIASVGADERHEADRAISSECTFTYDPRSLSEMAAADALPYGHDSPLVRCRRPAGHDGRHGDEGEKEEK